MRRTCAQPLAVQPSHLCSSSMPALKCRRLWKLTVPCTRADVGMPSCCMDAKLLQGGRHGADELSCSLQPAATLLDTPGPLPASHHAPCPSPYPDITPGRPLWRTAGPAAGSCRCPRCRAGTRLQQGGRVTDAAENSVPHRSRSLMVCGAHLLVGSTGSSEARPPGSGLHQQAHPWAAPAPATERPASRRAVLPLARVPPLHAAPPTATPAAPLLREHPAWSSARDAWRPGGRQPPPLPPPLPSAAPPLPPAAAARAALRGAGGRQPRPGGALPPPAGTQTGHGSACRDAPRKRPAWRRGAACRRPPALHSCTMGGVTGG